MHAQIANASDQCDEVLGSKLLHENKCCATVQQEQLVYLSKFAINIMSGA